MSELSDLIKKQDTGYLKTKLLNGRSIGIKGWNVGQENKALFAIDVDPDNRKNVIDQCIGLVRQCVDKPDEYDKLSRNTLIHLISQVRKLSKGAGVDISFNCKSPKCPMNTGKRDNVPIEDVINLDESIKATPFKNEPVSVNEFMFYFKEVPFETQNKIEVKYLDKKLEVTKFNHELLKVSIEKIVVGDKEFVNPDLEDVEDLLNSLTTLDYRIVEQAFSSSMSSFNIEKIVKCDVCDDENELTYDDVYRLLVF